jgi:hypothetical protein
MSSACSDRRRVAAALAALAVGPAAALATEAPAAPHLPKLGEAAEVDYWGRQPARPFVSSTLEAGLTQVRADLALGYGRPHSAWMGTFVHSRFSGSAMMESAGLAIVTPFVEVRGGARYTSAYNRRFLAPAPYYTADDIELQSGSRSHSLSFDAEAAARVPVPFGELRLLGSFVTVLTAPDDVFLFQESLKAVIRPPLAYRARAAYVLRLGRGGFLKLGPALEAIGLPGRDATIVRAGALASVQLSPRLEAVGTFIAVVSSPDSLGLAGGDSGYFGLRFRWASGSPQP